MAARHHDGAVLRLQQITGGYLALDDGEPVRISEAKALALKDILSDLPTDEPVEIGRAHV